jgi:hypothetical protein
VLLRQAQSAQSGALPLLPPLLLFEADGIEVGGDGGVSKISQY